MNKEYLKNIIVDQRELIEDKLNSERIIQREGLTKCSKYLSSPNVLLISGLIGALKEFNLKEGFILTETQEDEFKVDKFKIEVIPVWKWLLS